MLNIAQIDLVKLVDNALAVKKMLKPNVKFCAVVKANAYGHGSVRVANALYNIADCFAVAIAEEGVELRRSGIDKDVLVFNPVFEKDLEIVVRYDLTLTVQTEEEVVAISKESKRQGRRTKVQIKYNTGMNRLGVDGVEELETLSNLISSDDNLILDGMYSHLGAPENKKITKSAVNKFLLANNLVKGYNKNALCHLSASGGLLKDFQFDMVRVGILLYGYKPFPTDIIKVERVMKIYAPVLMERKAESGQTVLYGKKRLKEEKLFKLIRSGYADGLPRVKVQGLIENRCMDVSAVECNQSSEWGTSLGKEWFCVMDDADELAKLYRTIPYEILTKATLRAEKIYIT